MQVTRYQLADAVAVAAIFSLLDANTRIEIGHLWRWTRWSWEEAVTLEG
jgi:hypothetical protein